MLVTFVLALVVFSVLAFRGLGFLAWIAAAGVWLIGWRIVGVDSPLLFEIHGHRARSRSRSCSACRSCVASSCRASSCRRSRRCCRVSATPSASRSKPARSGGTASFSAACRTGRSCSTSAAPPLTAEEQRVPRRPGRRALPHARRLGDLPAARDLPPEIWEFIKEKRFFGMIIPKEYGGLGFSALAHSRVVHARSSSRSVTAAVTVMVPNSLGPGELLLHYGTEEQKKHYLPRLAERRRNSVLRADRSGSRLGCRATHSRLRHRLQRRIDRRQRGARPAPDTGRSATSRSRRSRRCSASRSALTIRTSCSATRKTSASPAR